MDAFSASIIDGVNLIKCPKRIGPDEVEHFKNLSKDWVKSEATVHVLEFRDAVDISPLAFQPFVVFKQTLKAEGKKLFSVHLNDDLLLEVRSRGLEQIFSPEKSVNSARLKAGLKPKKNIDVEFINPFLVATKQTLSIQANTDIQPLKPYTKKGENQYPISIAGVISLISDHFTGSITLCFPAETFLQIYNRMFDEQNTSITAEIEDAAGELLNIIYGQAKVTLNDQKGYELKKAIPTVLTADKLSIRQQGSGPVVVLPFDSPAGKFHIEIEAEDI